MDDARRVLEQLIQSNGCNFTSLSRLLGRNDAYIQQYLRRQSPRFLDDSDIGTLARFFGVDPAILGGASHAPHPVREVVMVPVLDGPDTHGALTNAPEGATAPSIPFAPEWLQRVICAEPASLAVIRVPGSAMEPTLLADDDVIADMSDGLSRLRDGLYALRMDDRLNIKRVALEPLQRKVSVVSDNPAYPSWHGIDRRAINVVGRVIWFGRRLA